MFSATSPNFQCGTRKFPICIGLFVLVLLLATIGCSTSMGQSSSTSGPRQPVNLNLKSGNIKVNVEPDAAIVAPTGRQQFTAIVSGTSNTAVTWATSAGTISSSGLFTAPAASSNLQITVTATSVADSRRHSSSLVTIQPARITILTSSLDDAVANAAYNSSLSASGGTPPYRWIIASGSLAPGISLNTSNGGLTGTPSHGGVYSFTVKATDAASNSATENLTLSVSNVSSSNYDGPAELPRVYIQSAMSDTPAPGTVIQVASGGNLQNALNAANCGDTIELQAGATYSGRAIFPAKACDDQHWIIVRTGAPDSSLPAEGVRMTPCYAGVASLPGRAAFNCASTQKVLATIMYSGTGNGPVQFASGANHYRLLGLEITRAANNTPVGALVSLIKNATADKLILDRVWIHGTALDDTRRGVQFAGSTNAAVVDSFFTDFHCSWACTDSQAISGGTGENPMGPYKIVDNFLEAAAECILFGGGAATQTPADIEIRRNHFYKPMIWLQGQPGFIGVKFIVKNHFELKNAKRVLLDSNIMENTWGGFSQRGFSVLLTPKNQSIDGLNVCPLCQVTDVTIRYLRISNVGSVFQIANVLSDTGGKPLDGQRYSIHDVVADSIQGAALGGEGTFALIESIPNPLLQNVQINHVTAFSPKVLFNVGGMQGFPMSGFSFTNSIVLAGTYPVWSTGMYRSSDCAFHDLPLTTMKACFMNYSFSHNAIIAAGSQYPSWKWPAGNFFVDTVDAVRFADYSYGNYDLLSSSPYLNAATDGTALGADVNMVLSSIAGIQ